MKAKIASLAAVFLLSWTVLPLLIPPFRTYTPFELVEVLFWQAAGTVGWPLGLLGGCANFLLRVTLTNMGELAMMLIYPGVLILLVRAYRAKRFMWWELALLHLLVIFSFAIIWYRVLNGYDFMIG